MLECPLCNHLVNLYQVCPKCRQPVIDGGSLGNFLGPYSPYEESELMADNEEEEYSCTHLLYCTACGEEWRVDIGLVNL